MAAVLRFWSAFLKKKKNKKIISSIIVWEIPRTEEPVGYSPWGSQKNQIGLIDQTAKTA